MKQFHKSFCKRLPRKLKKFFKKYVQNSENLWNRFDGGFQVTLEVEQLFDYSKMLYTRT